MLAWLKPSYWYTPLRLEVYKFDKWCDEQIFLIYFFNPKPHTVLSEFCSITIYYLFATHC